MTRPDVFVVLVFSVAVAACGTPRPATRLETHAIDTLLTRAERSVYTETSRYADVVAFLQAVSAHPSPSGRRVHLTSIGRTVEDRQIPLAVWGADGADSASVAGAGGTRVLLFANIHGGEVDGKEAAMELLRALARGEHAAWADSLVILVAPIYNADGNDAMGLDTRPLQNGPVGGAGRRANADGLDLNRDFVKADAPETRALIGAMHRYDPHVVLDLHTTNGSIMAYHLTYAPPLHPNTHPAIDREARSRYLAAATERAGRRGYRMWHYGNIPGAFGEPTTVPRGWYSFDPRPRYSTNYVGLRNRFGLLSESYSYASFETRIGAQAAFVEEIIDYTYRHATEVRRLTEAADQAVIVGERLAVRADFAAPAAHEVLLGEVDTLRHPVTGQPMLAMRDAVRPETMPAVVGFAASESERAPAAYFVPQDLTQVVAALDVHGIRHDLAFVWGFEREVFRVDSVRVAEREAQGRRGMEVYGEWVPVPAETGDPPRLAAFHRIPVDQPLGRLAFLLLEPRSDDGAVAWGLIPSERIGDTFPILRSP